MACKCDVKLYGLGAARCTIDFNIIRGVIFVDLSTSAHLAYYDVVTGLPDIEAMINNGVAVVSPKLFDTTANKEASTKQTFGDGTSYFIREGIRTLTATLAKPIFSQVSAFNRLRCRKVGVYLIDNNGYLLGVELPLPKRLLPIPIQNQTIDTMLQFATDTAVRTASVEFQFDTIISEDSWVATDAIPADTLLGYITTPPISVFQISPAPSYNTTINTLTISLGFSNGRYNSWEALTSADLVGSGAITLSVNGINSTGSYTPTSISGNTVTINVSGITVNPGDQVKLVKLGLNYPFIHAIQNTDVMIAV